MRLDFPDLAGTLYLMLKPLQRLNNFDSGKLESSLILLRDDRCGPIHLKRSKRQYIIKASARLDARFLFGVLF